jgi:two-component system C4-dicarboxylate transport sensor histidine kinase DctB
VSGAFRQWTERYNLPVVDAAINARSWAATGAFGFSLVLLVGVAPGVSGFFQLRVLPALLVLSVLCSVSLLGVVMTRNASPVVKGAATLLGNGLTVWFTASLVALSSAGGATVFALLPVFVAAYHGHVLRTGLRYPYGAIVTLAGLGGAFALDPRHFAIFALVTPLAVGVNLTLGTFALRSQELEAERERLRAAIAAQALMDREQLSATLLEVLGKNHDLGTTLSAACLNADWLASETRQDHPAPAQDEIRAAARELAGSLQRITSILADTRRTGRTTMGKAADLEDVEIAPTLTRVLAAVQRSHGTNITVDVEPGLKVVVRGGPTTLERIVENVLLNACEGDGKASAENVSVGVSRQSGCVVIEVGDDGPGFKMEALGATITAFATSKPSGTGLGLYTVERLLSASGGKLSRHNGAGGGAIVRIQLVSGSS